MKRLADGAFRVSVTLLNSDEEKHDDIITASLIPTINKLSDTSVASVLIQTGMHSVAAERPHG